MAQRKVIKERSQVKKIATSNMEDKVLSNTGSRKLLNDNSMTKLHGDMEVYIADSVDPSVDHSEVGFNQSGPIRSPYSKN